MKKNRLIFIGTLLILAVAFLFLVFSPLSKISQSHPPSAPTSAKPTKPNNPPEKASKPKLVFGVDTAGAYTSNVSECVANKYEKPKVVGRYLETIKGTDSGLTKNEVQLIHQKGARILPIYNHYTDFTGASQGKRSADEVINKAKQLGIPKGKVIAVDIEPKRHVDADFLASWTTTLQKAGYRAGIYGDFGDSHLRAIYLEALHKNSSMKSTVIWTNTPNEGTLHKPTTFKGKSPKPASTFVWQYGIDQPCHIDSDLVKSSILKDLW